MPLRDFYRALLKTYTRSIMDIGRAKRLTLRTRPSVWSPAYLRIWVGAFQIMRQFQSAHRHHTPREIARAMERGPAVPGLTRRLRSLPLGPPVSPDASRAQLLTPLAESSAHAVTEG